MTPIYSISIAKHLSTSFLGVSIFSGSGVYRNWSKETSSNFFHGHGLNLFASVWTIAHSCSSNICLSPPADKCEDLWTQVCIARSTAASNPHMFLPLTMISTWKHAKDKFQSNNCPVFSVPGHDRLRREMLRNGTAPVARWPQTTVLNVERHETPRSGSYANKHLVRTCMYTPL